jgi:hypothetical protein
MTVEENESFVNSQNFCFFNENHLRLPEREEYFFVAGKCFNPSPKL